MTPEFSRPERVDSIGGDARTIAIEADADERRRLADRFDLVAIDQLVGRFVLHRDAAAVVAEGVVEASVTQACSVTGDPLTVSVAETVALRFVDAPPPGEETELDDDTLDTIGLDGDVIDLGEIAAETMALALDPFPRGPGAAEALKAAGVIGEGEARPFGALAGLKAMLGEG